jgi:hypothetical protein
VVEQVEHDDTVGQAGQQVVPCGVPLDGELLAQRADAGVAQCVSGGETRGGSDDQGWSGR